MTDEQDRVQQQLIELGVEIMLTGMRLTAGRRGGELRLHLHRRQRQTNCLATA